MFKTNAVAYIFCLIMAIQGASCTDAGRTNPCIDTLAKDQKMYVIERSIPGAGHLSQTELQAISRTSNNVLRDMGSEIQWLHSYITGDKIYSIYTAPNEEMVREHARQGGFPANSVKQVAAIIDPTTSH